jgi:hypothetical protein
MAVCPLCTREMRDSVSCTIDPFIIGTKLYEPLPWGRERRFGRPRPNFACPDCATPPGGIHHHGCDVEQCPVCHGQAITCSCGELGEWDHHRSRPRCGVRPMHRRM